MFILLQLLPVGCDYAVSALDLRWRMGFSMDLSVMVVASCGVIFSVVSLWIALCRMPK